MTRVSKVHYGKSKRGRAGRAAALTRAWNLNRNSSRHDTGLRYPLEDELVAVERAVATQAFAGARRVAPDACQEHEDAGSVSGMANDPDRAWVSSMPEAYERFLATTIFGPFARELAARVGDHGPRRVLELAAGTGVLTRELVSVVRSGGVMATDLNIAMVEFGQRQVPHVMWRQADASNLPFGPGQFDLVACQFGVMFFPDQQAGFAEVRRVLEAEGLFVFNTWATLDAHEFEAALQGALLRAFPDDPPDFIASVPHGYADPEVVVRDLEAAGFHRVQVQTVRLEGRADWAADLASGYCIGTPLRAAIEARADLVNVQATITNEMQARLGTGAVTGGMTAHVIEATAVGH